jgi:hypothetical protein
MDHLLDFRRPHIGIRHHDDAYSQGSSPDSPLTAGTPSIPLLCHLDCRDYRIDILRHGIRLRLEIRPSARYSP